MLTFKRFKTLCFYKGPKNVNVTVPTDLLVSRTAAGKAWNYRQGFSSRLAVVFAQSIEARSWAENEDVVGAAPTGDAPTTSEWLTILLPIEVCLILEVLWYMNKWFELIIQILQKC